MLSDDEIRHTVIGKMSRIDDCLNPIHMMAQIGRRRNDRIREIGRADENRENKRKQNENRLPSGKIEIFFQVLRLRLCFFSFQI